MGFPDSAVVVGVKPMDGFQRGSTFIPTEVKIGQMRVTLLLCSLGGKGYGKKYAEGHNRLSPF